MEGVQENIPMFNPIVHKVGGQQALGIGIQRNGGDFIGIAGLGSLMGFSGAVGVVNDKVPSKYTTGVPSLSGLPAGGIFWSDFDGEKKAEEKALEELLAKKRRKELKMLN